ncbi:hypothetical protein HHI36_009930 [Cryptolaemus montrouzieri]|uniref:Uncharacterized protein n=1 Tax=Cryptolaemus montrouzieri TaxID=559131 RepID=A0ABD2MHB5_9CUCU
MEVLRTNQDIITNEVQILKSKLEIMDERTGSAGVAVSNVSRGSSIEARKIMERVRKSYNILIQNVPETETTDVKVVEDVLKIIDEMAYSHVTSICHLGEVNQSRARPHPRPSKIVFDNINTPSIYLSQSKLRRLNELRDQLKGRQAKGEKNITIIHGEPAIVCVPANQSRPILKN